MARARILVVEDEAAISDVLTQVLRRSGYDVSLASNGDDGLALALSTLPDLMILDIMLPGMDGWEVCRRLRATPKGQNIPIIMVTARREEQDVVEGLSLGADDYIRKPFSLNELLARVKARLRRNDAEEAQALTLGALRLDDETGMAWIHEKELDLSPTEFRILEILAARPGLPVSRERLNARLWGLSPGDSRSLDTHVSRLRKKLADHDEAPVVVSMRGRGYRLLIDGEKA